MICFKSSELIKSDQESLLYTRDVAKMLGVTIRQVYGIVHRREIKCIKVSGRFRFEKNDVEGFKRRKK